MLLPLVATAQDDETNADEIVGPLEQSVPVADEVPPPPPETAVTTEEQLMEEFARYRRLVQEGTFDEADVAAKRIVEMAIRVYGPQSRETASALNNLGIVQHSNGQYDAAIQNFTSSVEIIEIVEDRLNDALVNPLKGLGAAQLGNGRPDLAQKTFTRAAHITHVNEGPHNLDQVEILEDPLGVVPAHQLHWIAQIRSGRETHLSAPGTAETRVLARDPEPLALGHLVLR